MSGRGMTTVSRRPAIGELQQVSQADQVRGSAQRVGGAAMPGAGNPARKARAPQAREQLQYRRVDLFDAGAVDDHAFASCNARQQRAMQVGGLYDRRSGLELDARRLLHPYRLRFARQLLLAHATAAPGTSSSAMLLPMSRSMSSRMSIFSSIVASALTKTVSTLPHTSGGGLVSAASTL